MATGDENRTKAPRLGAKDAFWLTDLYPDAAALFAHQQSSLEEVSRDGLVILDANVLLWPLELDAASVESIATVYKQLASDGRLVVPGQAAREFYKHRARKVAALTDALDGAIQRARRPPLDKNIPLLSNDEDFIAAQALNVEIINAGKKMASRLAAVSQRLKDEIGSDRVSRIYRSVMTGSVVDIPYEEQDRSRIIEEAERRARLHIAPGYKDQNKDDGGIGDLIIWMTILHVAAERKTHCIFVTNEEKPDWWVRSKGAFQPRPELIEEYRRASGGKSVHFLPLSALLATLQAPTQAVTEVQKLEEERRESELRARTNLERLQEDLQTIYPDATQVRNAIAHDAGFLGARLEALRMSIDGLDPAEVPVAKWEELVEMTARHERLMSALEARSRNASKERKKIYRFPNSKKPSFGGERTK